MAKRKQTFERAARKRKAARRARAAVRAQAPERAPTKAAVARKKAGGAG